MRKSFLFGLLIVAAMSVNTNAQDNNSTTTASVTIDTTSYQRVIQKDENGTEVIKWVKATKVVPGSIVKYVDIVNNHTDQNITKLAIKNPINENLEYIADTAIGESNATVLYSVDNGESFDEPKNLYIGKGKDKRQALAKEYNSIQWTIEQIDSNSSKSVEFQAKLK